MRGQKLSRLEPFQPEFGSHLPNLKLWCAGPSNRSLRDLRKNTNAFRKGGFLPVYAQFSEQPMEEQKPTFRRAQTSCPARCLPVCAALLKVSHSALEKCICSRSTVRPEGRLAARLPAVSRLPIPRIYQRAEVAANYRKALSLKAMSFFCRLISHTACVDLTAAGNAAFHSRRLSPE